MFEAQRVVKMSLLKFLFKKQRIPTQAPRLRNYLIKILRINKYGLQASSIFFVMVKQWFLNLSIPSMMLGCSQPMIFDTNFAMASFYFIHHSVCHGCLGAPPPREDSSIYIFVPQRVIKINALIFLFEKQRITTQAPRLRNCLRKTLLKEIFIYILFDGLPSDVILHII